MSKTDGYSVELHGFYDYKQALLDEKMKNGAVAYNERFKEIVIKLNNDWHFLENHEKTSDAEKTLFKTIEDIYTNNGGASIRQEALANIVVEHNVVVIDGETNINILSVATKAPSGPTIHASKEEYLENENFGSF